MREIKITNDHYNKVIIPNNTTTLFCCILYNIVAVIIYYELFNPQVTNALSLCFYNMNISMLVGTSETVRMFSNHLTSQEKADMKIRQ